MTALPTIEHADDILVRLSKAHQAMHVEKSLHADTEKKVLEEAWLKHAPMIAEATSVFHMVQAEAYRAGFNDSDMHKVLSDCH